MTQAQKPDFVFPRNGRVHLNRWGRQFNRLLAAEVCTSALVMLDTQFSVVAWECWLPTPFASFPFTSPPARHLVPSGSERALQQDCLLLVAITRWLVDTFDGCSLGYLILVHSRSITLFWYFDMFMLFAYLNYSERLD